MAIWDCMQMLCSTLDGPIWVMNPLDLPKLPAFTTRAMIFSQYEAGLATIIGKIEQEKAECIEQNSAKKPVEVEKRTDKPLLKKVESKKKPFNKVVENTV